MVSGCMSGLLPKSMCGPYAQEGSGRAKSARVYTGTGAKFMGHIMMRLATKAWGMSGPVRIQEQNRT
jgi:hypothetical protein